MDISTVTDPIALKAMAYDAIAAKERADHDLQIINTQLAKVLNKTPDTSPKEPAAPNEEASESGSETASESAE